MLLVVQNISEEIFAVVLATSCLLMPHPRISCPGWHPAFVSPTKTKNKRFKISGNCVIY
jgi:hypothetical protein